MYSIKNLEWFSGMVFDGSSFPLHHLGGNFCFSSSFPVIHVGYTNKTATNVVNHLWKPSVIITFGIHQVGVHLFAISS